MQRLIGNESARERLLRLVMSRRVPNALLFAGPEGVGKKQFALELARSFVCTNPNDNGGCAECSACKRTTVFSFPTSEKGDDYDRVFLSQHPDVGVVIPYKRNLRVGAIRDLEREANFQPYEGAARIFIVDDADKMNDTASNALLKTLEEPPPTSHIILIAARADSLLATIRSRCQTIHFSPVDSTEIEKFLVDTERFSPEDAAVAARVSGGSIGRALGIVPSSFRTQRSAMLGILKAVVAGDKRGILAGSEEMTDARNKTEYEEKLEILEGLVHDVWVCRTSPGNPQIRNVDLREDLSRLAEQTSSRALADWLSEFETLRENFVVNINRKIATDAMLIKMAS
jgi:DNA polymerase-3 subunit delta'